MTASFFDCRPDSRRVSKASRREVQTWEEECEKASLSSHLVERFAFRPAVFHLAVPDILVTRPVLQAYAHDRRDADVPPLRRRIKVDLSSHPHRE